MHEALKKTQKLVEEAELSDDFHSKYANHVIATGDRSVDYIAYHIDLSENYYLIIDFKDFCLEDLSLVYKGHEYRAGNDCLT